MWTGVLCVLLGVGMSAAGPTAAAAETHGDKAVKAQLHDLQAKVSKAQDRNAELQAQVAKMERQNADRQKQLQQRDQEIAALQRKLEAAGAAPSPATSGH
jgi:peptidoglycan hydrolase CwlO-like protein